MVQHAQRPHRLDSHDAAALMSLIHLVGLGRPRLQLHNVIGTTFGQWLLVLCLFLLLQCIGTAPQTLPGHVVHI